MTNKEERLSNIVSLLNRLTTKYPWISYEIGRELDIDSTDGTEYVVYILHANTRHSIILRGMDTIPYGCRVYIIGDSGNIRCNEPYALLTYLVEKGKITRPPAIIETPAALVGEQPMEYFWSCEPSSMVSATAALDNFNGRMQPVGDAITAAIEQMSSLDFKPPVVMMHPKDYSHIRQMLKNKSMIKRLAQLKNNT